MPGTTSSTIRRCTARCAALPLLLLLVLVLYFPIGCAVGASSGVGSAAQQGESSTATGMVTPSFFGMVVQRVGNQPTVTTGSRRLWDSGVTWAALEPQPGVFAWGSLDSEVAAAQAAGAKITLVLGMTPTWASSQPTLASAYGAGATAMPADLSNWNAYVTAVATRYRGEISAYEVWDAPENPTEWSGDAATMGDDMATLAVAAASSVHAADPAALLVSPALSPTGLQAFLSAGGGGAVGVIAVSLDAAGAAPEAMTGELAQIHAAAIAGGAAGKPLWNEQATWTLPQTGLDASAPAAWVARALLLNAGYGVARLDWYAWDENEAGTLQMTDQAGQATSAALAYEVVEGWMSGAQANGCTGTAEGLWTCGLVRAGQTEWVLWSTGGAVQSSALGMSTVTAIDGSTTSVSTDGTVSVGESPVLLQ